MLPFCSGSGSLGSSIKFKLMFLLSYIFLQAELDMASVGYLSLACTQPSIPYALGKEEMEKKKREKQMINIYQL
jgi:hypothetical protein